MSSASCSVVTWNMEWKRPGTPAASLMLERIAGHAPDILCLTEAYDSVLAGHGGYQIEAEADYGYPITEGRRKVLLWSREPWEGVDNIGHPAMPPGRFVAARTLTAIGPVTVLGVCIPWRGAHVSTGRRDRQPWEDHLAYLTGLASLLARAEGSTIVVGDFNQAIPRTTAPAPVHAALERAMGPAVRIVTSGALAPLDRPSIDHVAVSGKLAAGTVTALDNGAPDGSLISDHFGVAATLRQSPDRTARRAGDRG